MAPSNAALTGRLEETSVFDLCHLLLPRRGCLVIDHPGERRAKVWISKGAVIDAQVDSLTGYNAFLEAARWHVGRFAFITGLDMPPQTINGPFSKLSLDAALYVDLWNNLGAWAISETTPIARYGYKAGQEHQVFTSQEVVLAWNFLHNAEPTSSVIRNLCENGYNALEAINAIHHLLVLGVVKPETQIPKTALTAPKATPRPNHAKDVAPTASPVPSVIPIAPDSKPIPRPSAQPAPTAPIAIPVARPVSPGTTPLTRPSVLPQARPVARPVPSTNSIQRPSSPASPA